MLDCLKNKAVTVAMSGGVDSSTTAALLLESGARVRGIYMALAQPDLEHQIRRVQGVAAALNIPLEVVDLQAPFAQQVLGYFKTSYAGGRTPNPCVICNRRIKFGLLLDRVLETCEYMATGHYARLAKAPDGRVRLLTGLDPKKDQSYFLNQLTQAQLARLCFPLGGQSKTQTREQAAAKGLTGLHGAESQDVCFLKDQSVAQFLDDLGIKPGPIVTSAGREIGRHQGIHHYTVGQRRGLGIPDATPYYVVRLEADQNTVVVGKEDELWQKTLRVTGVNWSSGTAPLLPRELLVKIRYRHAATPALVSADPAGGCQVVFGEPQRAVTPGQFAVFYQDDELLGGGEIL